MTTAAFLRGQEHPPVRPAPPGSPVDVVFVDRDGTLNALRPGYRRPGDFHLLEGAVRAVARLTAAAIPVVLVTNQQGIATGALSWDELEAVHRELVEALRAAGGRLDDIRVCPHAAGTCGCRKPLPGLFEDFFAEHPGIRPERCVMIGDAPTDGAAAVAAGCAWRSVGSTEPVEAVVTDLLRDRYH